jgi:hypothetical protein
MTIQAVSAQAAEWLEFVGGVSKKIETDLPFVGEKILNTGCFTRT